MPELLVLETTDWTIRVWSKDISPSQNRLEATLAARQKELPKTEIRFSPSVPLIREDHATPVEQHPLQSPLFFENRLYEFEFIFPRNVLNDPTPTLTHRLRFVEDSFHFSENRLRGTVNTGNDVGWFRLEVSYSTKQGQKHQKISFLVLPTKMDLDSDMDSMLKIIDAQYPLWRFSLTQQTEYEMALSSKPHERFPLLWLAQFEQLHKKFEKAVQLIIAAPHARLVSDIRYLRADRLKNRISPRLEEKIYGDFASGNYDRRYLKSRRKLSVDTPENRFIKMALQTSRSTLIGISEQGRQGDSAPEQYGLSESFFEKLHEWLTPIEECLRHPLFREVGSFSGLSTESLVLHQRVGYADVYRIWQQLKMYLDVLGNSSSISMKTVDELYEVWCLLELREKIFTLGFEEENATKPLLKNFFSGKSLVDGIGAAFRFSRGSDGTCLRLAHEPLFSKIGNNNIYSFITPQKPDIFLQASFRDGRTIRWIFDAKYRIEDKTGTGGTVLNYAPDDAINQMHRYRDALIFEDRSSSKSGVIEKSRPVLGAFILYPGFFDESAHKNPYQDAVEKIGIGAFPLLPGQANTWLAEFLEQMLGGPEVEYSTSKIDKFYVEDAARIPAYGMSVSQYQDLTLAVTTANPATRLPQYLEQLSNGKLSWFHMKQWATERNSVSSAVMSELRYCAVARLDNATGCRKIEFVYEVQSVMLVTRDKITTGQSGIAAEIANPEELYWLIKLGRSRQLDTPIVKRGTENHHYLKLTSYPVLDNIEFWEDLPERYGFMSRSPRIAAS